MSGHHVTLILEPADASGRCSFLQESHLLIAMHIVWNTTTSAANVCFDRGCYCTFKNSFHANIHLLYNFIYLFSGPCTYEYDCGECSADCGEATKECTIRIIREARYGGRCDVEDGHSHTVVCDNLPDCPPGK